MLSTKYTLASVLSTTFITLWAWYLISLCLGKDRDQRFLRTGCGGVTSHFIEVYYVTLC